MKKAMLIWNPAAGRVGAERDVREAARALTGWEVHFEPSQSAAHVTELAQTAARENWEAVFVAGGDGSLGRAVAGLAGSATALGVLPTGTTNVWAQELGLPIVGRQRLVESARQLAAGHVQTMDIGLCNGLPYLLWAGFGLDARVIDRLERKRSRWMKRLNEIYYLLTIFQCARGWPGAQVQVTADGQTVEGRFILALAGNIRLYAGGLLSPNARWNDGKQELWLLGSGKNGGVPSVIRHLWNLGRGQHVQDRNTLCLPFRQLKLTFATPEWMHLDGEPYGTVQEAEIQIWAQGLRVLVPTEKTSHPPTSNEQHASTPE
ncbi:MAG: diacylglycerol kinase family lipid kinase [Anaerolineales bacterium]|nr:diacylglycerol kinase family lipid kinase [Anaerolineales bacterium]